MYPIQDTSPFIELDLHTVPLLGQKIQRNPAGKKFGYSFTSNWQEIHSKTLNELPSPIGGLLTGKGGLVAIDCDCEASYRLFRSLDPTYQAYFDSIGKLDSNGKEIECGTILYQHEPDLPASKKLKGDLDLDYFNGTGMVFLPTEANETKAYWQEDEQHQLYNHEGKKVEFKPMPAVVKQVLELAFHKDTPKEKTVAETHRAVASKGYLAIQIENFHLKHGEYEPAVTRILTPREYRDKKFKQQGHLHPQDVGVRHDYLFKIMCTLAGDNTVDRTMALDVIMWFNSMLEPPRSAKQMHSEIIDGIISGRQKNQAGDPYWQYDEHWEQNRSFTAVSKIDGDLLHIFYDPFKKDYFVFNTITEYIDNFKKKGELMEHISATSIGAFNQKEAISDMANLETVAQPTEDFGYLNNDTQFNLFKPTEALKILSNPHIHETDYKEPTEFIAYIEHFIPDEQQRNYFLSLLRTKLTTFGYSPVVPYIIGVPGSGKGLLMTVLSNIIGANYVSVDVPAHDFLSKFNKTILEHKYFVNLNELADTLTNKSEKLQAQGLLKLYSGSERFQCQGKGSNTYTADMTAMFILTANHNPLPIEDNDRRVYYIGTPNTFISSPQCQASKSVSSIINTIRGQTLDIAYWLATEVENLEDNDYTTAPHHRGRNKIIFDSLTIVEKMSWALQKGEFGLLVDYLPDADPIFEHRQEGRIYLSALVDVYQDVGHLDNPEVAIKAVMKRQGFNQRTGTGNAIYYAIPDLDGYNYKSPLESMPIDEDAEDIRI